MNKEQLIAHLNRNVLGTADQPGLTSWRSANVHLRVTHVPVSLPASLAVEAPRNLRLLVSNPMGGQEVDIGSNRERFWIWTKDSQQIMTSRHEDVALALQQLEMPIHIHPDWLMEVFGVIPLDPEEFELVRPKAENGEVELVATRQSPLGEDVERVIRVSLNRGQIVEHSLRLPGGITLARAKLDRYTTLAGGAQLPLSIRLEWPDVHMQMTMDIRSPEVNSPSLASNTSIWQMPKNAPVVDIGALARRSAEENRSQPTRPPRPLASPGEIQLSNGTQLEAPRPNVSTAAKAGHATLPDVSDAPEWARSKPIRQTAAESEVPQPGTYSRGAWQSSSDPRLQGRE